jgi:hypothetical protein
MATSGRAAATRLWHGLTAIVALVSIGIELTLVANGHNPLLATDAPPAATRVIRFLSYFTIQSNLLVAMSVGLLALRPDRDGPAWRVLRLDGLFGITVTFVTYAVLLAPLHDPHGITALTNAGLHYVVPIMTILGWLAFGPRPRITENTIVLALIWPALYVGYTLIHGALSDWYPYPFIDVTHLGYATALRNGVGLIALLAGVAGLYRYLDRRLPSTDPERSYFAGKSSTGARSREAQPDGAAP